MFVKQNGSFKKVEVLSKDSASFIESSLTSGKLDGRWGKNDSGIPVAPSAIISNYDNNLDYYEATLRVENGITKVKCPDFNQSFTVMCCSIWFNLDDFITEDKAFVVNSPDQLLNNRGYGLIGFELGVPIELAESKGVVVPENPDAVYDGHCAVKLGELASNKENYFVIIRTDYGNLRIATMPNVGYSSDGFNNIPSTRLAIKLGNYSSNRLANLEDNNLVLNINNTNYSRTNRYLERVNWTTNLRATHVRFWTQINTGNYYPYFKGKDFNFSLEG